MRALATETTPDMDLGHLLPDGGHAARAYERLVLTGAIVVLTVVIRNAIIVPTCSFGGVSQESWRYDCCVLAVLSGR